MLFGDENIKCINTSPFVLVFDTVRLFFMESEEVELVRIGGGQKRQINVSQAAMASMISFEMNFRAKT
jgi:hypothetical protein